MSGIKAYEMDREQLCMDAERVAMRATAVERQRGLVSLYGACVEAGKRYDNPSEAAKRLAAEVLSTFKAVRRDMAMRTVVAA